MTHAGSRPNVVLIHGHDLGRWLSCYDRPRVPSPNLAEFAEHSVIFDQAFSTAPLCTPARSSLFSGMSPHVNGLMGLAHAGWRYQHDVRTLPELLADAGYDTTLIGLQHEHPDPLVVGFEEVGGLGFLPHADAVVDETIDWLTQRSASAPYLLSVGLWEAHRPWNVADYVSVDPAEVDVPAFLPDNEFTRKDLAEFYGAISYLDAAIGRLLETLNTMHDADNTLVIFTTDHGAALPGAKSTLYDPGLEVAFIVRPPSSWNVEAKRVSAQTSHLDVVPTLLEFAGAETPDILEGVSLAPLLTSSESAVAECAIGDGGAPLGDRVLYFEKSYHDGYDPIRAVRTSRWKYIRNFTDGPRLALPKDLEESLTRQGMGDTHLEPRVHQELYDLTVDPYEQTNLVGNERYRSTVSDYDARLTAWMVRTNDPLLDGYISPPPRPTRHDGATH